MRRYIGSTALLLVSSLVIVMVHAFAPTSKTLFLVNSPSRQHRPVEGHNSNDNNNSHVRNRMKLMLSSETKVANLGEEKSLLLSDNNEDTNATPLDIQAHQQREVLSSITTSTNAEGFSYVQFAKDYPFANNLIIATAKTATADLIAQTVIGGTPIMEIDVARSFLFCLFGAIYLGAFQYMYQVQVFKKLFDIEKFTQLSWAEKIRDTEGLKALAAQIAVDMTVLTVIYLPTFYIFKASVFSGSPDPSIWINNGLDNYQTNFAKDEFDLIRVWLPADLVCFSVPLYLRLPVRHVVSFVWTAYLSFARGGH